MHRAFEKDWSICGNIDDYAFLVYALIELYEVGFETKYLRNATDINNEMIKLFMNEKSEGFYFTSSVYVCTTRMCMNPTDDLSVIMKLLKQ